MTYLGPVAITVYCKTLSVEGGYNPDLCEQCPYHEIYTELDHTLICRAAEELHREEDEDTLEITTSGFEIEAEKSEPVVEEGEYLGSGADGPLMSVTSVEDFKDLFREVMVKHLETNLEYARKLDKLDASLDDLGIPDEEKSAIAMDAIDEAVETVIARNTLSENDFQELNTAAGQIKMVIQSIL